MQKTFFSKTTGAILLIVLVGLAGCGDMAFSPQQAAIRGAIQANPPGGVIDQNSIQVRQTVQSGGATVVALTYNRAYENRDELCMMTYQVERTPLGGWVSGSGGGGCSSQDASNSTRPPLEVGSGISTGGRPGDPGLSEVYGLVNQAGIQKVVVTWEDATQQEVEVVNGSYMAVRVGQFEIDAVEGHDSAGNLVYKFDRSTQSPAR